MTLRHIGHESSLLIFAKASRQDPKSFGRLFFSLSSMAFSQRSVTERKFKCPPTLSRNKGRSDLCNKMVHVPFLNIEVPEPRLAGLIPDFVTLVVRLCTRAVDHALHFTHPLPDEIQELFVREVVESFPREIQLVFDRACHGKHRDADQVSEELEDASIDYYRRMMRVAAVGETEEDQEDVTAYKLGWDRLSSQEMVWDAYLREHADSLLPDFVEDSKAATRTTEERQAIDVYCATLQQSKEQEDSRETLQQDRLRLVRSQVKPSSRHGIESAIISCMGIALVVGSVKGVGLLVRKLHTYLQPKKGKKGKTTVARKQLNQPQSSVPNKGQQPQAEKQGNLRSSARSSARKR
jgi:hypothetical protein